jgi:transcriptional regulator with GAF, ATPase, and Fis domain
MPKAPSPERCVTGSADSNLADGGTIFLDEVGEIPLDLQSKLLRVLQEREFERVGEETSRRVDVRIIAATNRDLEAESRAGRFREDLYYRLAVFPIPVPPLRDRAVDIGPLVAHFVRHGCEQLNRPSPKLTRGDVERLERYDWPGNVRELQNVIERALIRSPRWKTRVRTRGSQATAAAEANGRPRGG